jgi:hypothetical protein
MSTDDPRDGVALCLKGGGCRAMLFHVGVVRFEVSFRGEAALGLRIDLADPLGV